MLYVTLSFSISYSTATADITITVIAITTTYIQNADWHSFFGSNKKH